MVHGLISFLRGSSGCKLLEEDFIVFQEVIESGRFQEVIEDMNCVPMRL